MTATETAARFAAFTWYTECRRGPKQAVRRDARRFARANWQAFLPVAQPGWGRLLLRLAKGRIARRRARLAIP